MWNVNVMNMFIIVEWRCKLFAVVVVMNCLYALNDNSIINVLKCFIHFWCDTFNKIRIVWIQDCIDDGIVYMPQVNTSLLASWFYFVVVVVVERLCLFIVTCINIDRFNEYWRMRYTRAWCMVFIFVFFCIVSVKLSLCACVKRSNVNHTKI